MEGKKSAMRFAVMLISIMSFGIAPASSAQYVELPAIFSDNMVLQQKSNVPFWGKALPGERVTVKGSWGESAGTTVGRDSLWKVLVKTIKAGGPYEVEIAVGDSMTVFENVMLGEVWFCSGQSNMEVPLEGSLMSPVENSVEEIAAADFPDIRLFTVGRSVSARAQFNCVGSWIECGPKTAAKFSAVGYFFGKTLYKDLRVPIGLIHSSWGGTYVQSWISGKYLSGLAEYRSTVAGIDSLQKSIDALNEWIRAHPTLNASRNDTSRMRDNLRFDDETCSAKDFNDSSWKSMKLPAYWWETSLRDFDGAVWFRKTITIPRTWIGTPLAIHLGRIVEMDETWVNGVKVGGMPGRGYASMSRVYDVPKGLVRDSSLTVAVRIVDTNSGGETWSGGSQMQVNPKDDTLNAVSLGGEWKFLPVAEYAGGKFYVYGARGNEFYSRPRLPLDIGPNTPTVLYNGMLAPVMPFGIKGVIWYQGESNADVPTNYNNYKYHFSLLIKSWRELWGEGEFPFYWVQIAPWNYWQGWKAYFIRDAQRQTLSVPNTGMAVTLDIGSLSAIHPPNKKDVGARLALWALAKDYGKKVICSGPLYESMKARKGKAIISFKYVDGGLALKPINGRTNFVIAGRDSVFVNAEVAVVGQTLVVHSAKVKDPVAVRYAWDNAEEATLFNKAGLPASTFRTDSWSR